MGADITPGFRFYPTEEELVSFYLHNKLEGNRHDINRVIPVLNIYDLEPWQLPRLSGELCIGDMEQWFFFVPRQEREARGGRACRTTAAGYWKATGSPSYVYSSGNKVIGVKKSMVFYNGKAPCGRKTKWKMNEYRAIEEVSSSTSTIPKLRHEMSICRVYVISGSFRAFDRRPIAAAAAAPPSSTVKREIGIATSTEGAGGSGSSKNNNDLKIMERTTETTTKSSAPESAKLKEKQQYVDRIKVETKNINLCTMVKNLEPFMGKL